MVLVGLFLIAFSKEKIEDEQIVQFRLDSLRWAIYLNYAILLFQSGLYSWRRVKSFSYVEYLASSSVFYPSFSMGAIQTQPFG